MCCSNNTNPRYACFESGCQNRALGDFPQCGYDFSSCDQNPVCRTGTCCPGHVCKDFEEVFMDSLIVNIKQMDMRDKFHIRKQFEETLYDIVFSKRTKLPYIPGPPYIPSKPVQAMDDDEIFFMGLIPVLKKLSTRDSLKAHIEFSRHVQNKLQELDLREKVKLKPKRISINQQSLPQSENRGVNANLNLPPMTERILHATNDNASQFSKAIKDNGGTNRFVSETFIDTAHAHHGSNKSILNSPHSKGSLISVQSNEVITRKANGDSGMLIHLYNNSKSQESVLTDNDYHSTVKRFSNSMEPSTPKSSQSHISTKRQNIRTENIPNLESRIKENEREITSVMDLGPSSLSSELMSEPSYNQYAYPKAASSAYQPNSQSPIQDQLKNFTDVHQRPMSAEVQRENRMPTSSEVFQRDSIPYSLPYKGLDANLLVPNTYPSFRNKQNQSESGANNQSGYQPNTNSELLQNRISNAHPRLSNNGQISTRNRLSAVEGIYQNPSSSQVSGSYHISNNTLDATLIANNPYSSDPSFKQSVFQSGLSTNFNQKDMGSIHQSAEVLQNESLQSSMSTHGPDATLGICNSCPSILNCEPMAAQYFKAIDVGYRRNFSANAISEISKSLSIIDALLNYDLYGNLDACSSCTSIPSCNGLGTEFMVANEYNVNAVDLECQQYNPVQTSSIFLQIEHIVRKPSYHCVDACNSCPSIDCIRQISRE